MPGRWNSAWSETNRMLTTANRERPSNQLGTNSGAERFALGAREAPAATWRARWLLTSPGGASDPLQSLQGLRIKDAMQK